MASRSVVTAATTMFTAALVTASLGQGPRAASTLWQDARAAAVARLEAGQLIRVQVDTSDLVIGAFQRTGEGLLLVNTDGAERSVPVADMTGLWVRRHSVGTGAVIGALVLGATGAVLGQLCGLDEGGTTADPTECSLIGGAVGVAAGALLGGLIGAAIPKWHRRYP